MEDTLESELKSFQTQEGLLSSQEGLLAELSGHKQALERIRTDQARKRAEQSQLAARVTALEGQLAAAKKNMQHTSQALAMLEGMAVQRSQRVQQLEEEVWFFLLNE